MSALVLADDADYDIRIKTQMQDFARSACLLLQPLPGTNNELLDPTIPQPRQDSEIRSFDVTKEVVAAPSTSPYSDIDRWDLLWLNHCGCRFPQSSDQNTPLGRAVILR